MMTTRWYVKVTYGASDLRITLEALQDSSKYPTKTVVQFIQPADQDGRSTFVVVYTVEEGL